MKNKSVKTSERLSKEDMERLELLQNIHEKKGRQLRIDTDKGDLTEINELREMITRKGENPDEKYRL